MIEKGELHWADAFVRPFFILKESASFKIKNAPRDRTAADMKLSPSATRRRRRISKARFFFILKTLIH